MIYLFSFNKFSDIVTAFTCASATGNLSSICFGDNILRSEWSENLWLDTLASELSSKEVFYLLVVY